MMTELRMLCLNVKVTHLLACDINGFVGSNKFPKLRMVVIQEAKH